MRRSVKVFAASIALAVGATGVYFGMTERASSAATALADVGPIRPAFAFRDLDGHLRKADDWNGKVLLVNFWAPWCPPCRKEVPALAQLQDNYREKGLIVVGIALDNRDNSRDFADSSGINYFVLIAEDKGVELARKFGNEVDALPYTAVIDRNGRIVFTHRSELSYDEAEAAILPHL